MESQGEAHKTSVFHIKIDTVLNWFCYNCDIDCTAPVRSPHTPPVTITTEHEMQCHLYCTTGHGSATFTNRKLFFDLCTFKINKMSPTCHGTYINKETNEILCHFLTTTNTSCSKIKNHILVSEHQNIISTSASYKKICCSYHL